MKARWTLVGCSAIALGIAASAGAFPATFTGTVAVQVGGLPPVAAVGSGSGTSSGLGGAFSIPGNVFSIVTTAPISPPLLVIDGFGVGAPGQGGSSAVPLAPGTNKALAFGGVTGTMGLNASAYLLTSGAKNAAAAIPLAIIGVGGNAMVVALGGLIMGSIMANPYQLGMVTVMGNLNGVPSTVMGTGFDNRTANGDGVLQLVSPTSVGLGALGALASVATLTFSMTATVPEPTTLLLLGLGLSVLGALGRRNIST